MRALIALTVANIKTFVRDRAALFWTIAFPLVFIVLFGLIFTGGTFENRIGWVDQDGSPASAELKTAFEAVEAVELVPSDEETALEAMRTSDLDAVIIVPGGYGEALAAGEAGTAGSPANIEVITDPSQENATAGAYQVVGSVLGVVNLGGRPPLVVPTPRTLQTESLNFMSYFVPSILGLSLMQLGVFAAIPLVADREKLILKRLAATPLRRSQLVGSNVIMRLLIALLQTVIIIGVGILAFGVETTGNLVLAFAFVVLGALAFLALGYVIASFTKTEESANGATQMVQFPMMFLSGTFFPIDAMPDFLKAVAAFIPLTYLSDALRQVMVGGAAFAPLWVCAAVLAGWLIVCFGIASRWFRWQ